MKRKLSLIFLIIMCFPFLLIPVSAAFTTTTSDKGLPYDDNQKYTYFIKETSSTKIEDKTTAASFVYEIHVRDAKTSKILSLDTFEVKLSGLPDKKFVSGKHDFKITIEPWLAWKGVTVDRTVDYSYGATLSSSGTHRNKSWDSFKDEYKKSFKDYNYSYEDGTFMGRPALFVTHPKTETDNSTSLFLKENQDVYVYFNDIKMPNGIFVLNFNWQSTAFGELKIFTDYPDYQRRLAEVKQQVRSTYEQSKSSALTMFNSYQNVKMETKKTAEVRKYDDDNSGWNINVNTDASNSSGETGVSIPAIIVIGAAGVAAASAGLGGVGASTSNSGNSTESEEEEKKKSTYKMYIYKEFTDSIRYDKPAVIVYARIAEIPPDGAEIERTDLTQQINIFSEDSHMKIGSPTLAGNYVGSTVEAESVKSSENPMEGIVSFSFSGEGGSFCNNVKFKLVGEPYIKFDDQGDNLYMTVPMIEADNQEYTLRFSLHDFVEIPKVIIKSQDNSPFETELEKIDDFRYKVIVKNQSVKSDKPNVQSKIFNVEVSAEGETEYKSDNFRVELYPEGITVSIVNFDNNGYAQIGAYADNEKEEDGEEVLATRFKIELAVSTVDEKGQAKAELIDLSKAETKIEKLKGSSVQTENLSKVFKYEIEETQNKGIYKFQPKMQIPEGQSKHYLSLPISCEYQNKSYHLDLPIRLIGEPFNEMKAKKEELDLLLKRIKRYMPPDQWSDVIKNIKENYDNMSPKEIRLLNKSLYEITSRKLLNEAQSEINYAETLDWVIWGLEWVKWIGDQAFSYVAMAYTGPVGEALLSPTKEIMVGLISENIWYREGISNPSEKLRNVNSNLMSMLENSMMTQLSSDTSLKKAGFILASFTVIKIVNHYYNDVGPDGKQIGFYDAILAGLGDLTSNAFKFIVSEKFDELANSPKAKEYFNKYVSEWMKKFLDANASGWEEGGIKVIKKYVEELCGAAAAKVYTKSTQVQFEDKNGGLVININLWDDAKDQSNSVIVSVDVMKIKDKLYDYIFSSMFGNFPFSTTTLNAPEDPMFI